MRLTPHSSDDDDRRYRPESDREDARSRDPINVFGVYLRSHGLLTAEDEKATRERIQREVDAALAEVEDAALPDPETAFDHVYANIRMPNFREQ